MEFDTVITNGIPRASDGRFLPGPRRGQVLRK